jgi:hypothetical protein
MIIFPIGTALSTMIIIPLCVALEIESISAKDIPNKLKSLNMLNLHINIILIKVIITFFSVTNVICYVGNYAIIQMSDGDSPLYWLIFEAILMALRMIVWINNLNHDDPPPIQVDHPLTPKSNDIVWDGKVLGSDEFFEILCNMHGTIEIENISVKSKQFSVLNNELRCILSNDRSLIVSKNGMKFERTDRNSTIYDEIKYADYETTLNNLLDLATTTKLISVLYGYIKWNGKSVFDDIPVLSMEYKKLANNVDPTIKLPYIMYLIEKYVRHNKDQKSVYQKYNETDD